MLSLDIDVYEGGVAPWAAVPAVHDTTRLPMDRGIHVHAQPTPTAKKEMDCTFRGVRILSKRLAENGIFISELDAIYYLVTSVFGYEMKYVTRSNCNYPHLDRDWFSVHPHRRHLCAGCDKHLSGSQVAVGNSIWRVRTACGIKTRESRLSKKKLDIARPIIQAEFKSGVPIQASSGQATATKRRACMSTHFVNPTINPTLMR
jgi:hypothetical protein